MHSQWGSNKANRGREHLTVEVAQSVGLDQKILLIMESL